MDLYKISLEEIYNLIKEDKITLEDFDFWVNLQEDIAYADGFELAYG